MDGVNVSERNGVSFMNIAFPKAKKEIIDFLLNEEGNIPRSKMLMVGTMVLLLGIFYSKEAFARHSSHISHGSHISHASHVSGQHSNGAHNNQLTPPQYRINSGTHNNGSHSNSFEYTDSVDIGAPNPSELPAPEPISIDGFQMPPETQPNTFAPSLEEFIDALK